jgi:hypothetical protein
MTKQTLSITLIATLLLSLLNAPLVFGKDKAAEHAARSKAAIPKLGVGEQARVTITRHDKTKLTGYVHEAGSDAVTLADLQTGAKTTIPYADIKAVKGKNLSTGAKVGIGVAIGIGVAVIGFYILLRSLAD